MISEDEARLIAQKYLEQRSPRFTFRFFLTPQDPMEDWTVFFEVVTEGGGVLSTPIAVAVHRISGKVRPLKEYYEEKTRNG